MVVSREKLVLGLVEDITRVMAGDNRLSEDRSGLVEGRAEESRALGHEIESCFMLHANGVMRRKIDIEITVYDMLNFLNQYLYYFTHSTNVLAMI
jgi:hypothetical protein